MPHQNLLIQNPTLGKMSKVGKSMLHSIYITSTKIKLEMRNIPSLGYSLPFECCRW